MTRMAVLYRSQGKGVETSRKGKKRRRKFHLFQLTAASRGGGGETAIGRGSPKKRGKWPSNSWFIFVARIGRKKKVDPPHLNTPDGGEIDSS